MYYCCAPQQSVYVDAFYDNVKIKTVFLNRRCAWLNFNDADPNAGIKMRLFLYHSSN